MNFEITKHFTFDAAHSLPHLPKTHQCSRLHGHTYGLIIGVTGPLDGNHWVQDYADISAAVMPIIGMVDHQNINDVLDVPTTAENLALWFWRKLEKPLPLLSRIEIRETATSNVILTR